MAEEPDSPQQEESADTGEDEDIWDSTPDIEGEEDDAETEEEAEEESSEESEEEEPAEPAHDYEKRYKDLEREFHRRNEESSRFKDEFNDLRLRSLEQDKELDRLRAGYKEPDAPPDPTKESFFDDEDRNTMEEFSEITGVTKKLVQSEVAKAIQGIAPEFNQNTQRVASLEKAYQDNSYQQFLAGHEAQMRSTVGDDYREIDKDPDFQAYVLASPALTKMMTESTDPADHASAMNLWLENTDSGKKWRPDEKPQSEGKAKKQSSRRKTASNLMGNSAPRIERNPDNMSDEELWDSVPEPAQDF